MSLYPGGGLAHMMNKLEKLLKGRAIPRLTAVIIGCYVIGYILMAVNPSAGEYMSLNIDRILHGEIWRLITWVMIPPSSFGIFTIIMLFFYFSIGTTLEKVWGDFRYNVYILGGMLISIIAAFITYAVFTSLTGSALYTGIAIGRSFSTYYICLSILLAYTATFPDATVLLYFVLPIRMKYLGILYLAFVIYDIVQQVRLAVSGPGNVFAWIPVIAIIASLLNFVIFIALNGKKVRLSARQRQTRANFRKAQRNAAAAGRTPRPQGVPAGEKIVNISRPRHRCEVCGKTERTDPDAEFRYCSKCEGEHEYCMEHLRTHQHILIRTDQ